MNITAQTQFITPTAHEKSEMQRFARALAPSGTRACAEYFAQAAEGEKCTLSFYDDMMRRYRAWLVFGTIS